MPLLGVARLAAGDLRLAGVAFLATLAGRLGAAFDLVTLVLPAVFAIVKDAGGVGCRVAAERLR